MITFVPCSVIVWNSKARTGTTIFGVQTPPDGYDLLPWLPYLLEKTGLMGNAVEGDVAVKAGPELGDEIQRVRYDYWMTLIELFRERFVEPFDAWCHDQGVQSRAQAYGHHLDPLESSTLVDIPECETWLTPDTGTPRQRGADTVVNKFVSSAARLAGKKLVSCEEITDTSTVFFSTLEMIKIAGDESNLSGVTHSILHGFNYSPPAAGFPGWVRYGSYFNEQNPWWPYVRHWMDYKARLSWLLQASNPTHRPISQSSIRSPISGKHRACSAIPSRRSPTPHTQTNSGARCTAMDTTATILRKISSFAPPCGTAPRFSTGGVMKP